MLLAALWIYVALLPPCVSFDVSSRTIITDQWTGTIRSNPGGMYLKNQEYEWLIKVPTGGKYIELQFTAFSTECLYDYVSVYDSNDEETRLQLAAISGNLRPLPDLISDTGQLYIHLASDADEVSLGFIANFSVTICPNNCNGKNGRCNENTNKCTCNLGWYGEKCNEKALDCGNNGQLDNLLNKCRCDDGYFGWKCDIRLPPKTSSVERPHNQWYSVVQQINRQSILNWDQAKRMLPRQGHTADVIDDYLYIFGGYDLNIVLYSFKRLYIPSGNWSDVPINSECAARLPQGRYMHSSVVFQDSLLYCGGFFQTREIAGDCWLYNTTTACWTQYPDLLVPVTGHTSTLVPSGSVFLFGGLIGADTDHFSCSLYTLDMTVKQPRWILVTPAIYKCSEIRRYGHTAIYDPGSGAVVVFGGLVPIPHVRYEKSSDVLLFMVKKKVWTKLKIITEVAGLVFHSAVMLGRFMVVFGGNGYKETQNMHKESQQCFNPQTLIFDLGCMDWVGQLPQDSSHALATLRYAHAAAVYKDTMLVVGGFNGQPMNDVLLYFPPREECNVIHKTGDTSVTTWQEECNALQHCVQCNQKCRPVKRCRQQRNRCSVCYRLSQCTPCVLAGCEWCVQEGTCRPKNSEDLCGVQSPEPWWGPSGTLLINSLQCQTEDMPPGLHWIKVVDPVNLDLPDSVSIVKSARVDLFYQHTHARESKEKRYYGHLQGFINRTHRGKTNKYTLKVQYTDGLVDMYMGDTFSDAELVFSNFSRKTQKENRFSLPKFDMVYIEAVLSQYINDQQQVSNLTLLWDGGGPDYMTEEILHEDVLVPYRNGNCTHFNTCLGCLTDQLCGWNSSISRCQKRTLSLPSSRKSRSGYLITDFATCTTCEERITCGACAGDPNCEWLSFKCHRRGQFDNSVRSPYECPNTCSRQANCFSCTQLPDCVWCKDLGRCYSMNVQVALYPFGECSVWYNGFFSPGGSSHCNECDMYDTCRACQSVRGCGWCGLESQPHSGSCIKGNFEEGYCVSPSSPLTTSPTYRWHYNECPAVDECALGLHLCHEHAECIDTVDGFTCVCKPGFQDNHGNGICESKCDKESTCKHGVCNDNNICECEMGYTGPNCDQDCQCNLHSTCSQGQGICDDCQHLTEGEFCQVCRAGAFRTNPGSRGPCKPCHCHEHSDVSRGYCDRVTGECYCTGHTTGFNCELCGEGYYGSAVKGGKCYMVARSRVKLASVTDGAVGNVQSERRHRFSPTGYENVMWYIVPPLDIVSIVVNVNDFKSNAPDTPGVLYIWEGLPAHISGPNATNLTSRLLLLLSPDISSSSDYNARTARDKDQLGQYEVVAHGAVTILYEGMQSTKFNISYELRNCTHNCSVKDTRFNSTCSYKMDCNCAAGYMGPQCDTPICPDNCNNGVGGICEESTGICRCHESSSGMSCSEKSSAQVTWSIRSFDWVPPGHVIMKPRLGHSAVVVGEDTDKLVIHGGYDLYNLHSDTWLFDTDILTWTNLQTLINDSSNSSPDDASRASLRETDPPPRYFHGVVVHGNSMCVIGGITNTGLSSEVWCLEMKENNNTWTKLNSTGLPPIAGGSAVRYSEETWFLFGGVTELGISNDLFVFNVSANVWFLATTTGLVPAMYGHSMFSYNAHLHVLGLRGYYKYNIQTHTWTKVPGTMPEEITTRYHSAVQDGGVVYLVGGRGDGQINGGLYAVQLDSGSYIEISRNRDTAMLSSSLVLLNNKLYLSGGFNGTVHSLVLSYDLRDSICYLIREEEKCSRFGCAWCSEQSLYSPKPCIPTPIFARCKYNTVHTTQPCALHTDCFSCSANSCYWTAAKTCSSNESLHVACNGTCARWNTCVTCHENAQCVWQSDTCTETSNVVRREGKKTCPVKCSDIHDCTRCTVKHDCSWSTALETCLSSDVLDWFCLFNRCDLLVHPVQCPEPCSTHKTCSVCKEHNQCGWCQHDGVGECLRGDLSNAQDSTCENWHYFTCPLEDECALDVHVCRVDQLCVDLDDGYNCTCSYGFVNSDEVDACIPSCAHSGCLHGKCVDVDTCVCEYGYYGPDCSKICDCSGHSACALNGSCLQCEDNTAGPRCEQCQAGFILKDKNCVSCLQLCGGNSETCVDTAGTGSQRPNYLLAERTRCVNCQNNTIGDYCEKCNEPHYFRDPVTHLCRACTCNQHAWKCNPETGLDCVCQNHTESSYKDGYVDECSLANDCFLYQCDKCQFGYSGNPRNGSSCYQTLQRDELYNFTGQEYLARPFHIRLSGAPDHWIYIEMKDLYGTVYVSFDPKEYRIYMDEITTRHVVHHESFYEVHNNKRNARYTAHHRDIKPMKPWISGVDEIDTQYNYLRTDMNCERRFVKYSPLKYGPHTDLYFIVETGMSGGELRIQWYISDMEYNYYFTANLLSSGLILMLVFYYFMTNAINSIFYLWQQRAGRRPSVNNRPKNLVSMLVDISDYKCGGTEYRRGYTRLPQDETLPPVMPVVTREYFTPTARCGLSTLLIKLPGEQECPKLVFGTAVFKTGDKSLDFRLGSPDEVICETSI